MALLAVFAPLLVVRQSYDQVALPRLAATVFLTGVAVLLIGAARSPRAFGWAGARTELVLGGVFLSAAALATATGVDPVGSLLGEYQRYQGLLPLMVYAALGISTAVAVARWGTANPMLWGMFAGGVLASSYVVLDALDLDWIEWESRDPTRAGGLFGQPNVLALELLTAWLASSALWSQVQGWRRDAVAAGLGLMAAALVLTYSRGGWVGFVVGATVALLLSGVLKRRQAMVGAVVTAAAGIALLMVVPQGRGVLDSAVRRAESTADLSEQSTRIGLWSVGLEMAADRPLIGAGPDAFSVLFPRYRTADQPGIGTANVRPESAHSIIVDMLTAVGVVGLACWLGLFGSVLARAGREAVHGAPGGRRAALAATAGALAGYFVAASFAYAEAMTGWIPWVLAGSMLGLASGGGPRAIPSGRTWLEFGATVLLGSAMVTGGTLLLVADLRAGQAGSPDAVAARAGLRDAARLNPLQPRYRLELGAVALGAGDADSAVQHLANHNDRFAPTAYSLILEATARLAAGPAESQRPIIEQLLRDAEALDPHNVDARSSIERIRAAIR